MKKKKNNKERSIGKQRKNSKKGKRKEKEQQIKRGK